MANYPIDPIFFLPRGGVLTDGGGELRKKCIVVSLSGQQVKKNEDLAIALCDDHLDPMECQEFLQLIHHHITQVLRLQMIFRQMKTTYLLMGVTLILSMGKSIRGPSHKNCKGKGVLLPGQPSIEDYVQATSSDQVTKEKLLAEVLGGSLLEPVVEEDVHANDTT
ncbi:hypothetical protein GUJ93_ZPchr0010g7750 [Zizania palustris]|uniref:DUF7597 domain-containing protein n=1 Tax=Zizania palustris TaxID=103762 RepID=A0A8J5W8L5_ZIZPA|nr:hypothetical protein GUJ93_ZPchr0010g7750 [Zizania palustris]